MDRKVITITVNIDIVDTLDIEGMKAKYRAVSIEQLKELMLQEKEELRQRIKAELEAEDIRIINITLKDI